MTDLTWHKGLKNTGEDAEVYVPQSNPNGLIKCEVSREYVSPICRIQVPNNQLTVLHSGRNPNIVRAKI